MIAKIKEKYGLDRFLLGITIFLFLCFYFLGVILFHEKHFGRPQVFFNLLIGNAGLFIASIGMTLVLLTGGIDISIGSVIGLTCMLLAYCMEIKGMSMAQSTVLVLLFGIIFGVIQGVFIAYLEIQPFIVTLAGMFFARGLTAMVHSEMISITNPSFLSLAHKKIPLPIFRTVNQHGMIMIPYLYPSVIIAFLVFFVAFYFLKYTTFGRKIYAVGGNAQAQLMGINVKRTKFYVYVLNGFLAALAGFVFCLNSCGGFVEQARGFEMDAIASAVIGGTLLTGGVGNVVGTLFGVLTKGTIESFITFQGTLSSWWTKIAIAALLCFFIVLQSILFHHKKK